MKMNKDIHYATPNILELVPPELSPKIVAYMEMVLALLEMCY